MCLAGVEKRRGRREKEETIALVKEFKSSCLYLYSYFIRISVILSPFLGKKKEKKKAIDNLNPGYPLVFFIFLIHTLLIIHHSSFLVKSSLSISNIRKTLLLVLLILQIIFSPFLLFFFDTNGREAFEQN